MSSCTFARTETASSCRHLANRSGQAVFKRPSSGDAQCNSASLADDRLREFATRVTGLTAGWLLQLRRMEAYEIGFAHRLVDCVSETEAAAVSKQWTEHCIDSLMSMQRCLIDLWLDTNPHAVTTTFGDGHPPNQSEGIRHGG